MKDGCLLCAGPENYSEADWHPHYDGPFCLAGLSYHCSLGDPLKRVYFHNVKYKIGYPINSVENS